MFPDRMGIRLKQKYVTNWMGITIKQNKYVTNSIGIRNEWWICKQLWYIFIQLDSYQPTNSHRFEQLAVLNATVEVMNWLHVLECC